jgi:Ala-tRNA(Pro) deacylase
MPVAETLRNYLGSHGVNYEVVLHQHTGSSMETAEAAHIPGERLAKAVLVEDDNGYLMVIVPSTHHVDLGILHKALERPLGLATEAELAELFPDCEPGAIPALGPAYGIAAVWDSALAQEPEVYFEGGDHELVIRVSSEQFRQLLADAPQGRFSHHL